MTPKQFSQAVEAERKRLGVLTYEDLAKLMKLSPSGLSYARSGKNPIKEKTLQGLRLLSVYPDNAFSLGSLKESGPDYKTTPQVPAYVEVEVTGRGVIKIPVIGGGDGLAMAVAEARKIFTNPDDAAAAEARAALARDFPSALSARHRAASHGGSSSPQTVPPPPTSASPQTSEEPAPK